MSGTINLEPYREAIRQRICSICHDSRDDGSCRRPAEDLCALVSHVEEMVNAVVRVGVGEDVGAYLEKLRSDLCPTCRQDEAGDCSLRVLADCAADAYILPVIEVIEDVARERGDRR